MINNNINKNYINIKYIAYVEMCITMSYITHVNI